MASVSKAYVRRQAGIVAGLGESAKRTIAKRAVDVDDWDSVAAIVSDTCKAYTDMSAAVTAQYYAGIRKASRPRGKYTAVAASGYEPDRAYAAAISVLKEAQEGAATAPVADLLGNIADREVKNAADHCVRENVRRDPARPRYAIVPGGDACAFCQMRASLGYTYADEGAVESHSHCTCTATPVFGDETVEGYDPDEYKARYDEAADALRSGDISDELKERIEREKAAKGRDYDRTNAILAVMREQQGIS